MTKPGIKPIDSYPMPTPGELPPAQVFWTPDPGRAALLVHDMQMYFLRPFPGELPPAPDLVRNAAALRDRSAALGMPVFYTAQPGSMTEEQRGLLRAFWGPGMKATPADREVVSEIAPGPADVILTKWRYSAFHRTGLLDRLREAGRDQLIITGVYAHVGCLVTALDAFTHDIQPFLVADGVADFSAEYHRLALDYAAARCAAVPTTKQILDHLGLPGTGR